MNKHTKRLLFVIVIGFIAGLVYYSTHNEGNNSIDRTCQKKEEIGIESTQDYDTISSFVGYSVVLNNDVYEQIAEIARKDKMISYSDSVLYIGKVGWRINYRESKNFILLITSVEPDTPQMEPVISYLKRLYGTPYEEDDVYDIKWSSSNDPIDIFKPGSTLVHFRRIHSEEGGTCLIFQ